MCFLRKLLFFLFVFVVVFWGAGFIEERSITVWKTLFPHYMCTIFILRVRYCVIMIGAGIRYVVKKDVLVIVIPWVVRLYVEIIHEL